MPLFRIAGNSCVHRINAGAFDKERQLQQLIEANLLAIFGVHLVASEFFIRGEQAGRIDTLGLDTDGAPTIIEYKRSENENVINQGLYYMNWLLDHRGDFVVAAHETLGNDIEINWSNPRLIILAQSYAKWDTHAVRLMGEGIELWAYTLYGDDLLHIELVYGQQRSLPITAQPAEEAGEVGRVYTLEDHLAGKPARLVEMFNILQEGIFAFALEEGGIIETPNKLYISYRHGRNFCEIEIQAKSLKLTLDIPQTDLNDPRGLARDVASVGHWATGDTQLKIESMEQAEYALELIEQAYRQTV